MCLGILHTLLVALPKALDHVNDPLLSKIRDDFHYFILVSQNEVTAFRRLQKTIHICESTSIPNFQKTKKILCGADRDRTCDLLNANQALSQLSYSPKSKIMAVDQVGLRGLEPRTSSLSGMRSNHLSYKPKKYLV